MQSVVSNHFDFKIFFVSILCFFTKSPLRKFYFESKERRKGLTGWPITSRSNSTGEALLSLCVCVQWIQEKLARAALTIPASESPLLAQMSLHSSSCVLRSSVTLMIRPSLTHKSNPAPANPCLCALRARLADSVGLEFVSCSLKSFAVTLLCLRVLSTSSLRAAGCCPKLPRSQRKTNQSGEVLVQGLQTHRYTHTLADILQIKQLDIVYTQTGRW